MGLRPGDVILEADKTPVDTSQLVRIISQKSPGEAILLTIWRRGQTLNQEITVTQMPEEERIPNTPSSSPLIYDQCVKQYCPMCAKTVSLLGSSPDEECNECQSKYTDQINKCISAGGKDWFYPIAK